MEKRQFAILHDDGKVAVNTLDMEILFDELIFRGDVPKEKSLWIIQQMMDCLECLQEEVEEDMFTN